MNDRNNTSVTENDLHAWVDNQLSDERRQTVDDWLETHPEDRQKVETWRRQNVILRDLFPEPDAYLGLPLSRRRASTTEHHRTIWRNLAAALILFIAGGASALLGQKIIGPTSREASYIDILQKASRDGYGIYASEVRHPVEVYANEKDHLVTWLGKRLGMSMTAPDLETQGFELVGGRLVPFDGKTGALLMYQDGSGARLTVMIARDPDNGSTAFRYDQKGSIGTFYWVDQGIGYALSGEFDRDLLESAARSIYAQLPT